MQSKNNCCEDFNFQSIIGGVWRGTAPRWYYNILYHVNLEYYYSGLNNRSVFSGLCENGKKESKK